MLISGTSQRIHSDQVPQGKFAEPGAQSSWEEFLVKAAVTEVYFHINFVSSLSKQTKLQTCGSCGSNPEQVLKHLGDNPLTPSLCSVKS